MKASQILQESKNQLKDITNQAYQESLWILEKILKIPISKIHLEREDIDSKYCEIFFQHIQKRKSGVPLEYILKEKIFFGKVFYVEDGVFIPRAETETLIRWILKNIKNPTLKGVDFGAGTGALCLTLLSQIKQSEFIAMELNPKSIKSLKKNSKSFHLENRLHIVQKDILQINQTDMKKFLKEAPHLIVANPPYIDPTDTSISEEVYFFEPPIALFSNKEGMGHIISWFKKAMECLNKRGIYLFEFGWNQLDKVRDFLDSQKKIISYQIIRDDMGRDRVAICFKK